MLVHFEKRKNIFITNKHKITFDSGGDCSQIDQILNRNI